MPSSQDTMLQEALSAIQSGSRARARDLLTRLLKTGQDNPEYWLWMSAVVDSQKERSFCLNQVLKLDPENAAAKRGLAMMGIGPVDDSQVIPGRYQRRNWQSKLFASNEDVRPGLPRRQLLLLAGAFVVVVGMVLFALLGQFQERAKAPAVAGRRFTHTPTVELSPTPVITQTGTIEPTPLALMLEGTYTPTPLYVNTPHPAVEAYRAAIRAYGRGDWEAVRRFMADLLVVEPSSPDAHFYIGEAYRAEGNFSEALKSYARALEVKATFAPAFLGRARATLGRSPSEVRSAQADIEKAIELDGNYGEAYLELGLLHANNNNSKEAVRVLEPLIELMPSSPLVYLYLGQAYLEQENTQKAISYAMKARELDITLLATYRLEGQALQARGDLAGSVQPLATYTAFEESDAEAWLWLGLAQQHAGNSGEAFKSFDRALKINSSLYEALLRRGQIYLEREDGEKAAEDFRAALRVKSDSFDASIGIARAMMAMGFPGDGYMQLERSSGMAKTDAQKAELYFYRGQSLDALKEYVASLRTWRSLLALPEKSVQAEWVQYAQNRVDELTRLTPTVTQTRTPTSTQTRVPTSTRVPTKTQVPTATRMPTSTQTQTATPRPTLSPTATTTPRP